MPVLYLLPAVTEEGLRDDGHERKWQYVHVGNVTCHGRGEVSESDPNVGQQTWCRGSPPSPEGMAVSK